MTDISRIKKIISENKDDIAFVIGNGINRYPNNPKALSWDNLLMTLWNHVASNPLKSKPKGVSITEFYDILELENGGKINLQKEVVELMRDWQPLAHHKRITDFIQNINAPILTTNFDDTLTKTSNYNLFKLNESGFTDFYPWGSYYGDKELKSPTNGFGIWHINGMLRYHRSIRLGLSQYMGSVERTRNMLYKGKNSLFYSDKPDEWNGCETWLDIVFNKSLFIFGIGLDEGEVFLRWLLIQRIRYFRKHPNRIKKGWYITTKPSQDSDFGKIFFLEKVGIEVITVNDFKDIYHSIWLN